MQVDNDLNQFVAAKGFQAFQDPGCTIFPAKSRIFKSGDNLSPVASLIKHFERLDRTATKMSDTQYARKMGEAKAKLLRQCKMESPFLPAR